MTRNNSKNEKIKYIKNKDLIWVENGKYLLIIIRVQILQYFTFKM